MNQIILLKFEKLGIDFSTCKNLKEKGWSRMRCPKCDEGSSKSKADPDLGVNVETGQYKCQKCQWKGNVTFQKKTEYIRPVWKEAVEADLVKQYLFSRGISETTLSKIVREKLLSYSPQGQGFLFNYFRGDQYVNYKARQIGDKKFYQQNDGEKILFNINSVKGKEEVILVEGEMSVLACIEAGLGEKYGIVSLENGAAPEGNLDGKFQGFRNCYDELLHVKKYIICLDNDKAGLYTANELIRLIGEEYVKIVDLPEDCKDPDDVINRNKRGQYTAFENNKALFDALDNAFEYPVSGIMQLDDALMALLMNYKKAGRPKPFKLPMFHQNFNIKSGEYTVISGYANAGKSTLAMFIANLMILEHGFKWAVFAGEQYPMDRYYEDLAHMMLQKPVEETDRYGKPIEGCATDEEYDLALHFIRNHVTLINPEDGKGPTLEWLMEKTEYLRKKEGINGVIIDTFNKLRHDWGHKRDDQYLDEWHDNAIKYARKYDAFFLLMHPSKPMKMKNGQIPAMNMYDISHGAMTPNKVDNILIYNRPTYFNEDGIVTNDAILRVEKIRDQKTVGRKGDVNMIYDPFKNSFQVNTLFYQKTIEQAIDKTFKKVEYEVDDIPF